MTAPLAATAAIFCGAAKALAEDTEDKAADKEDAEETGEDASDDDGDDESDEGEDEDEDEDKSNDEDDERLAASELLLKELLKPALDLSCAAESPPEPPQATSVIRIQPVNKNLAKTLLLFIADTFYKVIVNQVIINQLIAAKIVTSIRR